MRIYAYMRTIGTITMLTLAGCPFFEAGTIASTIAVALFILSPRVSRLIDRVGQRRVVPAATCIALAGCVSMLFIVAFEWPLWLCYPAAVLMGFLPTPQALTRARWVYLIRSGRLGSAAPDVKAVFSYEGILDDVSFMISPALSIALASSIAPVAGMVFGVVCCAAGMVLLSSSRSTEPEVAPPEGGRSERGAGECGADAAGKRGGGVVRAKTRTRSLFSTSPVVRALFFLMLLLGCCYGIFDTATVSFAQINLGNPSFASVSLMAESVVSAIVGLLFGMMVLNVRQSKKTLAVAIFFGATYGFMAIIDSALTLVLVASLAALSYAPYVITLNETAEHAVPPENLTEALTWVSSGSICGLALGPTLGGLVIDELGAVACFGIGAIFALAIPVLALAVYPLMKRTVD